MAKLKHNLLDYGASGGDAIEKRFWLKLKDLFPNYEVFWSQFIWDWTLRQNENPNIHLNSEIPSQLLDLSMCHYTTFRSLIYISILKDTNLDSADDLHLVTENEKMKNIYAHFGIIGDMASRIFWQLENIENELNNEKPYMHNESKLLEKLKEWFPKEYAKEFNKFQKSHKPVDFHVHRRRDSLEKLAPQLAERFDNLFDKRLVLYRNLIHNPDVGRIFSQGKAWIPKPDHLKECALWTDMQAVYAESPEKFEPLSDAINKDFQDTLNFLNDLWDVLITKLEELQQNQTYSQWFNKNSNDKSLYASVNGLSHTTTTSYPTHLLSSNTLPDLSKSGICNLSKKHQ